MKEFLSKLKKTFLNKTVLVFVLGGILGALGMSFNDHTLGTLVCLIPGLEGC